LKQTKIIKMKRSIDEQNEIIIKSMFGSNLKTANYDNANLRIHEEMLESVRNHRKVNGLTSKITILRNFLKTRKFVKTTMCV
jgi:hypothetical protein